MTRPHRIAALVALSLLLASGAAGAQDRSQDSSQDRSPGLLDNLFGGQRQSQQPQQEAPRAQAPRVAQSEGGDDATRVDRIESALRQLTGTIEQLQHDNQMLQMQIKRLQDDTDYRFQQMGQRGPAAAPGPAPMAPAGVPPQGGQGGQGANGRRSDVFDPSQNPNAVGAPRTLGNASASAIPPVQNPPIMNAPQIGAPVGAPGGRDAGAPLDLSALAGNPPEPPSVNGGPQTSAVAPQGGQLPPVMAPRNTGAAGTQLATLPPSASPKDEYDLAYGYVLRKDYALAAQAFGDFMAKYPKDKMLPNAQYWFGESQYQQQRYREAAESFLAVSTKYERSGKAPESLLRLGQSLAALNQKEAACATLAEVARKYPKASPTVKRDVAQEQKRGHC
jgi:tol-pal system protein YbgF